MTSSCSGSTLLEEHPRLAAQVPWRPLGCLPTPVERLRRLSAATGVDLWIKRDDASGRPYGGNKVRKLEHLLAAALEQGARTIVTVGGAGSNHMVATAAYGRALGLRTVAVVVPQPPTPTAAHNLHLAAALGVELVPCPARPLVPLYLDRARRRAERPYVIGPGGSSPLGSLGYVSAALELKRQIEAGQLPEPRVIFVPLGSGGTMAGLLVGCALAGLESCVVGVRVVERVYANAALLRLLVHRTRRLLQRAGLAVPSLAGGRALIRGGYVGRCYGAPTKAATGALARAREAEGLELETTYSAKAMAALLDWATAPGASGPALFWHTFNSRDTSSLAAAADDDAIPERIRRWFGERGQR